ncbi:hypothetical protein Nepgr_002148 [Nepenthes gracilis]|uniref:Uncharacterized protein n=1 Tax=Nepenthes gracilis TaxID=150966 RepID=A0AAD3P9A9_NEPGR|nr:hypothetical protein Nepgr_002148 [Nepenthes gracilis]
MSVLVCLSDSPTKFSFPVSENLPLFALSLPAITISITTIIIIIINNLRLLLEIANITRIACVLTDPILFPHFILLANSN